MKKIGKKVRRISTPKYIPEKVYPVELPIQNPAKQPAPAEVPVRREAESVLKGISEFDRD